VSSAFVRIVFTNLPMNWRVPTAGSLAPLGESNGLGSQVGA